MGLPLEYGSMHRERYEVRHCVEEGLPFGSTSVSKDDGRRIVGTLAEFRSLDIREEINSRYLFVEGIRRFRVLGRIECLPASFCQLVAQVEFFDDAPCRTAEEMRELQTLSRHVMDMCASISVKAMKRLSSSSGCEDPVLASFAVASLLNLKLKQQRRVEGSVELIFFKMPINRRYIRVLIDNGSTTNFFSPYGIRKAGLGMKQVELQNPCQTQVGNQEVVTHVTFDEDRTVTHELNFYVMDKCRFDAAIGLGWLKAHCLRTTWGDNQFVMRDAKGNERTVLLYETRESPVTLLSANKFCKTVRRRKEAEHVHVALVKPLHVPSTVATFSTSESNFTSTTSTSIPSTSTVKNQFTFDPSTSSSVVIAVNSQSDFLSPDEDDPLPEVPSNIRRLLNRFPEVMDEPRGVPKRPVKHKIEIIEGSVPPKGCVYHMGQGELEELRSQIDDMIDRGWIRPRTSAQNDLVLTGIQYSGPMVDKRAATLPSKYDGKADITSWISSMRSYFEVMRTPQEDRSMIMGTNTEPAVRNHIELQVVAANYERIDLTEWLKVTPVRTLEDLLLARYQDKHAALKARLKLEALKGQTWRSSMQALEQHLTGLFTTPDLGMTDVSCMDVVMGVAPKEYLSLLALKDHTTWRELMTDLVNLEAKDLARRKKAPAAGGKPQRKRFGSSNQLALHDHGEAEDQSYADDLSDSR
ncbi:hypothetical protein CBR_g12983 [Chara braunii]|uniref:Uncharacterized protein n=1 Tax=Chara braunii TaxID=69332 RepID=A0A388KT74_CHABU|nr:hypothetical protein CBR_g12983 [Chara braunii]|eukprot:GBG73264.1 hypothetical protein CBR_g12983 [Chara braunii]